MADGERPEPQTNATDGPMLDLGRYVPALLTFLANKLNHGASALYRRHFGVGTTEWRIISTLAIEPWIPAQRICQIVGLDKAPVSRSLAGMERRGMVAIRPDPADARRRLAALTEAGRALHDRILVLALERERRLLDCLEPDQREVLIRLLNRLHDNLPAVNRPVAVPPK